MNQQPLTNHQKQQNMARILIEELWDCERDAGELLMKSDDYKEVRLMLIKSIGIIERYK